MNAARLYNKSTEDILSEIKQKSAAYTPEWRFDAENPDGGAALARLFAEMFSGTAERFNRIPEKYYLEFLNVLGVCAKSVSPAVGFASARLGEKAEKSVYIKKGTQLFTDISAEDGEDVRVFFETDAGFYASPAEIKAIYTTDFDRDVINRAELSDLSADCPVSVFAPNEKKNLLRHRFGIAHSAVLGINGAAEIRVKISDSTKSYKNEEIAERLCAPSFAEWSFLSASGRTMLTARRTRDYITLTKDSRKPIALTDEDGSQETDDPLPWIFCDMKNKDGEITADEIFVASANRDDELRAGIIPDSLFAGDTELNRVTPPIYIRIDIYAEIECIVSDAEALKDAVISEIKDLFSLYGKSGAVNFGKPINYDETAKLINSVPGVSSVSRLKIRTDDPLCRTDGRGGIIIPPDSVAFCGNVEIEIR